APLLDILGEQPGRDVHPAASRVDHGVFDRGGGKVAGLEPDEFGFGVVALRCSWSYQQCRQKRKSNCIFLHELPPCGLRRTIKATRITLDTNISAVPGR